MYNKKALFYVSLAVFFWSTVATAFKLCLQIFNVIQLLFIATITSLIILFLIVIQQKKLPLFKAQTRKQFLLSAFLGLFNPFIYYLVLFKAYDLLPAQIAQPLNYTWVIIFTILTIIILKQKFRVHNLLAILVSFSGVVIISTRGNFFQLPSVHLGGVCLAISTAFLWAIYWIINLKDLRDPIVKLFTNFIFGACYISIITLQTGNFSFNSKQGIITAIYVGLFEMGLTFFLWLKALSLSKNSSSISNFIYLAPFISLIFIYFIVGEKIHPSAIIGLTLIIIGIFIQTFGFMKRRKFN